LFVEVLTLDEETVDWDGLTYRSIPEWDSIAHMALVGEIEDEFDIMLETDDVIAMSSFPIACEMLKKYGVPGD
jgi:acyl carrier protein